jgi:AraC-like DNA-binding protein
MFISIENTKKAATDRTQNKIHYDLLDKLDHVLETEKRYLDPNLTLGTLAKELHTNREYLSRTINLFFGTSYTDHINGYRIKAALEILQSIANGTTKPRTILKIANASGFKSTSTFNPAFRKVVGETPTEYRSRIKIEKKYKSELL